MTGVTMLRGRVPFATPRLSRRPKVSDQFYSSPEWRALVREVIAVRGRRCHIHELKDGGAPHSKEMKGDGVYSPDANRCPEPHRCSCADRTTRSL
jgi:hypothetical protein